MGSGPISVPPTAYLTMSSRWWRSGSREEENFHGESHARVQDNDTSDQIPGRLVVGLQESATGHCTTEPETHRN